MSNVKVVQTSQDIPQSLPAELPTGSRPSMSSRALEPSIRGPLNRSPIRCFKHIPTDSAGALDYAPRRFEMAGNGIVIEILTPGAMADPGNFSQAPSVSPPASPGAGFVVSFDDSKDQWYVQSDYYEDPLGSQSETRPRRLVLTDFAFSSFTIRPYSQYGMRPIGCQVMVLNGGVTVGF